METKSNINTWISVSTLALRLGVSTQTIYNRIKSGKYKAHRFNRGKLSGVLVDINSVNFNE